MHGFADPRRPLSRVLNNSLTNDRENCHIYLIFNKMFNWMTGTHNVIAVTIRPAVTGGWTAVLMAAFARREAVIFREGK